MNDLHPEPRRVALERLATNLRWSWDTSTQRLLAAIPGANPERHPLRNLAAAALASLGAFIDEHGPEIDALAVELSAVLSAASKTAPDRSIAYFSPEFGVAAAVAQYSGGLGILAGDHLKSASDLGVPLIGVGLLYREGFFRQDIVGGRQTERYETVEPADIGAVDTGVVVAVPIDGASVAVRVWRQMVGATPLLLLDTDVEGNERSARKITDRLYSGDRRHRLDQELVLGVGGVRALRALGIAPEIFHLNEGHACFLLLELLGELVDAGAPLAAAVDTVRGHTLFTTHTPVPAGIDRFDRSLVEPELAQWAERLGTTTSVLLDWALLASDGPERPFNTAALALHLCDKVNGVSQLHASVSRQLFASHPRSAGIAGITNGVHARTWISPALQDLYDQSLGAGWEQGDASAWARAKELDTARLATVRDNGRRALVSLVADRTGVRLDPEACIIGFARRFATYKRAALLLRDPEGLEQALAAGAQFVFAGKAHPADGDGKAVLAELARFAASSDADNRIVLVPDYDIGVAQSMYAGCDVWLNNPIRPHEACGTSGEKAALNGAPNCSILDGWWADFFVDGIGWAIPTSDLEDPVARDLAESTALHDILVSQVLPRFGTDAWWDLVRTMLAHLGPLVTAGRMVAEYDERFYRPRP